MPKNSHERWNYSVLLAQGTTLTAGYQLTSLTLVLPFLYSTLGAPIFFAGLLAPIVSVSKLLVQVFVTSLIRTAQRNKWFIVWSSLVSAVALAVVTTMVNGVAVVLVIPIFTVICLVLGATMGITSLAAQNLIGQTLPHQARSRVLFNQSSIAGLFAVGVTFASQFILPPTTSNAAHQELIWLGVALIVIASILAIIVREPTKAPRNADGSRLKSPMEDLRESYKIASKLPWFPRFLVARTLILSVELSSPFYAVHAASFHAHSTNGLSTFVIASSLGLVFGGFIWPRIGKNSVHVILVSGACIAGLGGLLAMAIELGIAPQGVYVYAIVFVLFGLGAQATQGGRKLYLMNVTTDEQRPVCIAISNVISGVMSIVFGGILGALASLQGVAWPIVVLIVLNVVTAVFTFTLKNVHTPSK